MGTIYAHVVSAVVIPLLIFSIISSITNLGNSVRLKNIGLKTVFFLDVYKRQAYVLNGRKLDYPIYFDTEASLSLIHI